MRALCYLLHHIGNRFPLLFEDFANHFMFGSWPAPARFSALLRALSCLASLGICDGLTPVAYQLGCEALRFGIDYAQRFLSTSVKESLTRHLKMTHASTLQVTLPYTMVNRDDGERTSLRGMRRPSTALGIYL